MNFKPLYKYCSKIFSPHFQGLNTKVAQVAAYELGVPLEFVKILAHDTLNGANGSYTAASICSSVICTAVRKACKTLNARLAPIKATLKPDATWSEITNAAYKHSANLIANDDFKPHDLNDYRVPGLVLTEVFIDLLTGNTSIKRVDICEDTGKALSPLIDIGQIEGAFVMGLGYWLSEQLIFNRQNGELLTNRTWNYKPPGAMDIPIDFRIKLSSKYTDKFTFMGSKTTGEPAICLAVSAIFAIQHAIQSARKDAGLEEQYVILGAPTTPETILLNCGTDAKNFTLQ